MSLETETETRAWGGLLTTLGLVCCAFGAITGGAGFIVSAVGKSVGTSSMGIAMKTVSIWKFKLVNIKLFSIGQWFVGVGGGTGGAGTLCNVAASVNEQKRNRQKEYRL